MAKESHTDILTLNGTDILKMLPLGLGVRSLFTCARCRRPCRSEERPEALSCTTAWLTRQHLHSRCLTWLAFGPLQWTANLPGISSQLLSDRGFQRATGGFLKQLWKLALSCCFAVYFFILRRHVWGLWCCFSPLKLLVLSIAHRAV